MPEFSRRSFLRGMLTVAAVSIAPLGDLTASVPRIVGDGVHDDTAGLQAAMNDEAFECEGLVVRRADSIFVGRGIFRINSPIAVNRDYATINGARFVLGPGVDWAVTLNAKHAHVFSISAIGA